MLSYASSCRPGRNIDAMKAHGWRLLFSPFSWETPGHSGMPYCLDSGAWTAHKTRTPFDEGAYARMLRYAPGADFLVLPDVVGRGPESLSLSLRWICRALDACARVLLPVQNGVDERAVRRVVGGGVGIFVGGLPDGSRPEWKLRTMRLWAAMAKERATWCHVGRVNTPKRIRLCALAGVDSFDGTNPTKFSVNTPKLSRARDNPLTFLDRHHGRLFT